jgi:hypothetical protein
MGTFIIAGYFPVCAVVKRLACFRGVPGWTLGRTSIILTKVLRETSRSLQAHTETVPRLNHICFLPDPSQVTFLDAVQPGYPIKEFYSSANTGYVRRGAQRAWNMQGILVQNLEGQTT